MMKKLLCRACLLLYKRRLPMLRSMDSDTGEAIAHMANDPCDVAFLDIEMKGMNGVEVAERFLSINPNVNIIFATGFGSYRDAAFDMHASGYLIKPITTESVKRELEHLRYPVSEPKRLRLHTFGNFDVLYDRKP